MVLAAALLAGCLTDRAVATNRTWTGNISANWSEPGNWSPSGVPQNADNLTFDQDSPNRTTVNDLANLTVGSMTFNNNYSYQVSGNALTFTNGAEGGLIVFSGGSSTITVDCGLIFSGAYGIYVRPGAVFGSGNKVYVHINGPITVPGGQVQVRADSESDATGSWTSHLYLSGPLSGAGDIIVRAVDSGGGNGSIEFDNAASSPTFTGVLWLSNSDEYGNRGDHLDPTIFVNVGSLSTGGSHVSASIQGEIELAPNAASPQFNIKRYAIFYPFDTRPELEVPANLSVNGLEDPNLAPTGIIKNGSGRMDFSGNGTFLGGTVIHAGTLP